LFKGQLVPFGKGINTWASIPGRLRGNWVGFDFAGQLAQLIPPPQVTGAPPHFVGSQWFDMMDEQHVAGLTV
jgi:hypothetical protein